MSAQPGGIEKIIWSALALYRAIKGRFDKSSIWQCHNGDYRSGETPLQCCPAPCGATCNNKGVFLYRTQFLQGQQGRQAQPAIIRGITKNNIGYPEAPLRKLTSIGLDQMAGRAKPQLIPVAGDNLNSLMVFFQ